jgi:hypothetical protein
MGCKTTRAGSATAKGTLAGQGEFRRLSFPLTLVLWVALVGLTVVQVARTLRVGGTDLGGYLRTAMALSSGGFNADPWENAWPPFFALFVLPLALLNRLVTFRQTVAAWLFLDLAASIALVLCAVRAASPSQRPPRVAYVMTALCAAPYLRNNLQYGQVNTLLTLFCVVAFARVADGRDDPLAGFLVGLAASVKAQAGLVVPWFLVAGRRRGLTAALATGVLCAVAPAAVCGWPALLEAWRFWMTRAIPAHLGGFGISAPAAAHQWVALLQGHPISSLPRRPFAEGLGTWLSLGAVAALYWYIWRRSRRGHEQPPVLDVAVLLPAAVVASPLAWRYHLVALVPAYAAISVYLLHRVADSRRRRWVVSLAALSIALAYGSELGAIHALAGPVELAERAGSCVFAAWLAMGALLVARGDAVSDAFVVGGSSTDRRTPPCPSGAGGFMALPP